MLKQYYPPEELNAFISSILIIKKFTAPIKIFPGTGAEIWISSQNLNIATDAHTTINPFQLVIPRINTFTVIPNNAKVMVLRVRHDALRFLLPQRTVAYTDTPTALCDIWSDHWFEALSSGSFQELRDCFIATKASKKHISRITFWIFFTGIQLKRLQILPMSLVIALVLYKKSF